jgi:RNA polymerase sigma-70 factor (ECF subfamily)
MELTMAAPELAVPAIGQHLQALEISLSKYYPAMYRAAVRKLRNAQDAEDAVQDALLSAYRKIAQFKGESHISTWLVAIAINSARMQLRRRLRHRVFSLSQTSDDGRTLLVCDHEDSRPGPEEMYSEAELRAIMKQYAAMLSPTLRRPFRLRVLGGLSIQETAQILRVSEGTLKAQLFRARSKIQVLMRTRNGSFEAKDIPNKGRLKAGRRPVGAV